MAVGVDSMTDFAQQKDGGDMALECVCGEPESDHGPDGCAVCKDSREPWAGGGCKTFRPSGNTMGLDGIRLSRGVSSKLLEDMGKEIADERLHCAHDFEVNVGLYDSEIPYCKKCGMASVKHDNDPNCWCAPDVEFYETRKPGIYNQVIIHNDPEENPINRQAMADEILRGIGRGPNAGDPL
jgi:hypothetical protein